MTWSLLLHILQVILGIAFIFYSGRLSERREIGLSIVSFIFGAGILASEFIGFVVFIGPLLK